MPDPRDKGRTAYKIQGENMYYFFLRSMFTGFLFMVITLSTGIWQVRKLGDVLTSAFVALVIFLILIYFFTGIAGRITAFLLLRYLSKLNRKSIKTFWHINSGINKLGMKWFISVIVKSFLFALGVVVLLQNAIFDSETVYTLIGTYVLVEIIVSLILRFMFWWKG